MSRLRSPAVLVDHPAEHLPALHRRVQRHDWLVMIRWPLVPGLVRPVSVVVADVGLQHSPQMRLVVDQHPVSALGPDGPYPALGVAIRPRRPRRRLYDPYALAGQDVIECDGELRVAVTDEEPERADPGGEVHDQMAGLLDRPRPVRVPGHPKDVDPPR